MNHVIFLTQVYPTFQSFLPGGLNYDLTDPLDRRVIFAYDATINMLQAAVDAECNHCGLPGKVNEYEAIGLLRRYMVSGTFSSDRRKWKAECKRQKVWSGVNEWAVPTTPDDQWNWDEFRKELSKYLTMLEGYKAMAESLQKGHAYVPA